MTGPERLICLETLPPFLPPSFRLVLDMACPSPVCMPSISRETFSSTLWRATAPQLSYTWRWEEHYAHTLCSLCSHTNALSSVNYTYWIDCVVADLCCFYLSSAQSFNQDGALQERLMSSRLLCITGLVLRVSGETSCFQQVSPTALPGIHRGRWLVHAQEGSQETGQVWEESVMVGGGCGGHTNRI